MTEVKASRTLGSFFRPGHLLCKCHRFMFAQVPESCCILQGPRRDLVPADNGCVTGPNRQNSYFNKGCYNKFVNSVKNNQVLVLGALVGLGAAQFLIIIFSLCLCRAAGRQQEEY